MKYSLPPSWVANWVICLKSDPLISGLQRLHTSSQANLETQNMFNLARPLATQCLWRQMQEIAQRKIQRPTSEWARRPNIDRETTKHQTRRAGVPFEGGETLSLSLVWSLFMRIQRLLFCLSHVINCESSVVTSSLFTDVIHSWRTCRSKIASFPLSLSLPT